MANEIIYGRHPVIEALKAGTRNFKKILVAKTFEGDIVKKIISLAREKKIPVEFVAREKLICYAKNHQGIVAYVSPKEYLQYEKLIHSLKDKKNALICVLDEVEDPQNLGVILRSAACFGVDGIIVQKKASANISSGTAKASAGAIEYVPIVRVSNISQAIDGLKENGFWIYGAEMSGGEIWKTEVTGRIALVIGNEHSGLRHLTKQKCDFLLRIPIHNNISSLNAAISASIIFYEINRQRHCEKKSAVSSVSLENLKI